MSPDRPLPLPAKVPPEPGRLSGPSDALAHVGPAAQRPFLASSRCAAIRGSESGGIASIEVHGAPVLADLTSGAGACANVVLGPRSVRRELVGRGGSVLETATVADRQPGVVAQWVASGGGGLAVDVTWTVPGRASAHRSSGSMLRVRPEMGSDRLYHLDPAPGTWDMETRPDGLRVRVRVRADHGRVTLVLGTVPPRVDGSDLLRALLGTEALNNRADAFSRNMRADRFAIRTGVVELDDALAWAVARTAGAGSMPPDGPSSPALETYWLVSGALAAGDLGTARALVDRTPESGADVLALGRWVLWTADSTPLIRHRDAALAVLGRNRDGIVERAARSALRRALEAAGTPVGSTELDHTAAFKLPTVDAPSPGSGHQDERLLTAILLGGPFPSGASVMATEGTNRALHSWALFSAGHPETGYGLLREHLAQGLRTGAGLWPDGPEAGRFHDPVSAALVPAIVLCGLLGVRSEAPWGRVHIAPRLPSSWTRFEASGIRVADARVSLRYEKSGNRWSFQIEQVEGRVPLTLVFEPSVVGPVTEVRVDDVVADIGVEHGKGGSRARVQLALDATREVVLLGPSS